MKILLDLSKHCIETEAKRIYEESLRRYFSAPDSEKPELEEKIEGLKNFLEYSDFNHLRNCHPVLAGMEGGKAIINILGLDLFEIEASAIVYKPRKNQS